ncbi:MAG: hypothetical protein WBA51_06125 [Erythrobacter sp.]
MARTTQTTAPSTAPEPRAPDFTAWHVRNRRDKAFWTKVGAAWFHRERKGLAVQLEVVPINGRAVLRMPLDDENREVKPSCLFKTVVGLHFALLVMPCARRL